MEAPIRSDGARAEPAIAFRNVSFAYTGGGTVLERITLEIADGEFLGILGPNGGGKSTLLKLMLGLEHPNSGSVRVAGLPPDEARRRGMIGYVPQRSEAERVFPLSVRSVVELAGEPRLAPWRWIGASRRAELASLIELVGLGAQLRRPVGELSGGQFQRLLIARALASKPRILALDEPTVGIDPAGQERFSELVQELHRRLGLTILLVSHDVRAIASGAARCDRVACLSRTLHFHAAPQGLTPQVLAEVFSHDLAQAFGEVHVDAHAAHECPGGHTHDHAAHGGDENEARDSSRGEGAA